MAIYIVHIYIINYGLLKLLPKLGGYCAGAVALGSFAVWGLSWVCIPIVKLLHLNKIAFGK